MNDLVKYLMAWGGLGWPGGGLGVAWGWPGAILPSGNHPGTSKKPSGIWRLAGLLAGLPWAGVGLLLGWVAILGWLGLAGLANRNLKIW